MLRQYFRRPWDQRRGDGYAHWGASVRWFETDRRCRVLRQIEVYDDGPVLAYHAGHPEDARGGLTREPLDLADFMPFRITSQAFERRWAEATGTT